MARAIVRYSISGEPSNVTGNAARERLTTGGFQRIGTASMEADGVPEHDLIVTLQELLATFLEMPGRGHLDHLWIYLDAPDDR